MDDVKEGSKTAHLVGKDPKFYASKADRSFMGMPVPGMSK